ncbi:Hypothetical predicted protein [Podarcis lilfordi]|uniref:Uncharacterized protein n=1 Tax=Podarcis lilfordi TaxID=74358 RepID=A0AA35LGJ9_9SAUR|nr:Hypothetical predicted protein [Podarcis lilfordi]
MEMVPGSWPDPKVSSNIKLRNRGSAASRGAPGKPLPPSPLQGRPNPPKQNWRGGKGQRCQIQFSSKADLKSSIPTVHVAGENMEIRKEMCPES